MHFCATSLDFAVYEDLCSCSLDRVISSKGRSNARKCKLNLCVLMPCDLCGCSVDRVVSGDERSDARKCNLNLCMFCNCYRSGIDWCAFGDSRSFSASCVFNDRRSYSFALCVFSDRCSCIVKFVGCGDPRSCISASCISAQLDFDLQCLAIFAAVVWIVWLLAIFSVLL